MKVSKPCKDCQKRTYKCHSNCEHYNKFLKENEQRKRILSEIREQSRPFIERRIDQCARKEKRAKANNKSKY